MKSLKSYLKKILLKYFMLLFVCLLTYDAYAYIKFDVSPDTQSMGLTDLDDYNRGELSQEKLDKYMEKPLKEWAASIKKTECADYVQEFIYSMNFPKEPLTVQYIIEHEMYFSKNIKEFLVLSEVQLIYFNGCKNPTAESNNIKDIITSVIAETKNYNSIEEYQQAQQQKEIRNTPCETFVTQQYDSIKYRDLRLEWNNKNVKKLTSYDIITFEYSLENLPGLKQRLDEVINIYNSCSNPTDESKRLLSEFQKTRDILSSGKDYKQIVFDVMQNEYNEVQKILSSMKPTQENLEKLKIMQNHWGYRPLADKKTYPEFNEKMQLIYDAIKSKQDEIANSLNKEKQKINKIHNDKLLKEAIKEQKKALKKLDLPRKILNANMYDYGFYDKPYINVGTVREVISLILYNPKVQKVSARYNDDYIVFGIKEHGYPTKYYAFNIDDEDIYFKGIEKDGFIVTTPEQKLWHLTSFLVLRNLQQ